MQEGQVVFGLLLFISEPIPNGIRILVKNGEKMESCGFLLYCKNLRCLTIVVVLFKMY